MHLYNSKRNCYIVLVAVLLGGLFGTIYSYSGAADTFALFSIRAAEEIVHDGTIINDKTIYSFAMTQYHQGLEFILASLLAVTGISNLDLVYLPVGSILYSLGAAMLILCLISNRKVDTRVLILSIFAIWTVVFSAGGYVQPFYSIFHQSWGFYISFLYLYVLMKGEVQEFARRLVLILLFLASGLIYYTINNWLLIFNITVFILIMIKSHLLTSSGLKPQKSFLVSSNFLIFSFITWWLVNTITSQELLFSLIKQPSELLRVFYNILFRREQLLLVETAPPFIGMINRSIMILSGLPILIYILFRLFRRNKSLTRLGTMNIDLIVLFFLIVILADTVGYGLLGCWYVTIRHLYLLAPLISVAIFLTIESPYGRYRKLLFLAWAVSLIVLGIMRCPYMIEDVSDNDVKLQKISLENIVKGLPPREIFCDYKTIAVIMFSLKDVSAYRFNTFMKIFDEGTLNYKMDEVPSSGLVIVSAKAMNSYVWIQEWKMLPPIMTISHQLNENLNLICNSRLFTVWLQQ